MHVMKLLGYGPAGREQPGMLDPDGIVRSLGGHVRDIGPEEISPAGLRRLAAIDPSSLPAVPGSPRLGPPCMGTRKFIAIGFDFSAPPAGGEWDGRGACRGRGWILVGAAS